MDKELWMPVDDFCLHYKIEQSFISNLNDSGLIEITTVDETGCIPSNQLSSLEKYVRLYYDLQINIEGIEAITHMLERIKELQHEVRRLKQETSSLHLSD